MNENVWILLKISLIFVPKHAKVPINNIPALVQIMAWHWPCNNFKPSIWTNDGKFTDAYMHHSASMSSTLMQVLLQLLQNSMPYHMILFRVIKALDCTILTLAMLNLFGENKMYLRFLSFLNTEMAQIVGVILHGRQGTQHHGYWYFLIINS